MDVIVITKLVQIKKEALKRFIVLSGGRFFFFSKYQRWPPQLCPSFKSWPRRVFEFDTPAVECHFLNVPTGSSHTGISAIPISTRGARG